MAALASKLADIYVTESTISGTGLTLNDVKVLDFLNL
jgi:hypothetical protein